MLPAAETTDNQPPLQKNAAFYAIRKRHPEKENGTNFISVAPSNEEKK